MQAEQGEGERRDAVERAGAGRIDDDAAHDDGDGGCDDHTEASAGGAVAIGEERTGADVLHAESCIGEAEPREDEGEAGGVRGTAAGTHTERERCDAEAEAGGSGCNGGRGEWRR
jgi:hypothetical protein